ncbi:MAG TPA: hypothetical protein VK856_13885 [Anaerolineaceae bacterium]|nr:hypothetical protein [Anaerolineaceae bacterium]
MVIFFIEYLPIIIVALSSLFLFVSKNWRWNVIVLAIQYVAVFWMILQVWTLGLAVVKLISGWMAGAILGSSLQMENSVTKDDSISEKRFKIVLIIIIWIILYSITPQLQEWLPVPDNLIIGATILIVTGILQFAITSNPIRVIIGLLTSFSGFEVIYAGIENSIVVAGFRVIITLGIALTGALFIQQQEGEIV